MRAWGGGPRRPSRAKVGVLLLSIGVLLGGPARAASPRTVSTPVELRAHTQVQGSTNSSLAVRLNRPARLDLRVTSPGEGGVELRSRATAFAIVLSDVTGRRVIVVGGSAASCPHGSCPQPDVTGFGFTFDPKTSSLLLPAGGYELRVITSGGSVTGVLPIAGARSGVAVLRPRTAARAELALVRNNLPEGLPAFGGGATRDMGGRGLLYSLLTVRGSAAAAGDVGFCFGDGQVNSASYVPGCPGAQQGPITDLTGFVTPTAYTLTSSTLLLDRHGLTSGGWWYAGASLPVSSDAVVLWVPLGH